MDLRPTSSPSSLFPPQLPGLTHLNSSTRLAGKAAPQVLERRQNSGPPGTQKSSKVMGPRGWHLHASPGSGPSREGGERRGLASNHGGQSPQAHAASSQSSRALVIPPHTGSVSVTSCPAAHHICFNLPVVQFPFTALEVLPR